MAKIDLHIHTNASDGRFSPADIVQQAARKGLTIIAIADHDTVDGIAPALSAVKNFPGLRVIPAVEISTDIPHGEVHILGYFIDYTDHSLQATLKRMRDSRRERARRMIAKLGDLGMPISWERVQEIAGSGAIGRPHIAQAMLEKGYIQTFTEAFAKYISRDGPAYIEREKMTPQEAVELILQTKGLPVLAHPFTIPDPETMIIELKATGLIGIEAYYNGFNVDEVNKLVGLANKHNLIASGGSDYHGLDDDTETMIGGVDVPMESTERLIALAEPRAQKLAL